ncbi:MAG: SPOR domain-containing protein [Pseudomonadota bacterium]
MASDRDDIDEYEDEYDEFEDEEEGGLSGLVVLLMGVVMLGAFASVVWIAYQQGARSNDAAPVIAADPEPVRIERAADASAQQTEDRAVYDSISGGETTPVEVIAEGPEEPVARNADDTIGAIAGAVTGAAEDSAEDTVGAIAGAVDDAITDDAVADRIAQLEAADQALQDVGDDVADAARGAAAGAVSTIGDRVTAPTRAAASRPAASDSASSAGSSSIGSSSPREAAVSDAISALGADPLAGSHLVQVAAFRSEEEADAFWRGMSGKLGGYLDGKAKNIEVADLGDRGIYYRLRIGPFASSGDASSYCAGLKERGQDCIPRAK